ncbi:MAG: dienelactone hydrolase family protein [Xanthobacteraceae bacterium]
MTVLSESDQCAGSAIIRETLALDVAANRSFEAHVVRPEQGRGLGILILTEMWGVTRSKLELAETYARSGFCVLVPNVFWRSQFPGVLGDEGPERERAWERLRAFDFGVAGKDLGKAVAWLRGCPSCTGKVAAVGFCLGGRLAFLAATRAKADAAISLYALGIAEHLDEMAQAPGPVQLHYGLADIHIPLTEIEAVSSAAAPFSNISIYRYPGVGHGFFNENRAAYNAAAVALAEERIERLFGMLGGDGATHRVGGKQLA